MLFFPLKIAMKVVSLMITALVAYLVLSAVQVVLASRASAKASDLHPAEAIAVDGETAADGSLGTHLSARIDTAAQLAEAHVADRVIVVVVPSTTANGADPIALATALLEHDGLSSGQFSVSTAKSGTDGLRAVAASLTTTPRSVVIVTDAIDLLWTKGAAASAGLAPQVVPADGSKVALYTEVGALARETSGVAAGRIIGDLRATWAAD